MVETDVAPSRAEGMAARAGGRGSGPGRFQSIQYLRAIAALMVVVHHARNPRPWLSDPLAGFQALQGGVDIFFVISGFIMYAAAREEPPASFLARRAIRIAPLYWIATTLVLLLAAPAAMSGELVAHFAKSLAFIPQASPYKDGIWPLLQPGWTLNYEMFFYLVFAAGLAARRLIPVVATTLAALVAAGLVLKSENPLWLTYTNPLLLEFMAGLALARWRDRLLGSAWLGWLLPAGFLALLLSTLWAPDPVGPAAGGWTRVAAWGLPALAIVAGGAAIETAGRLPRLPWLGRLGDASYAIYLFQGWPLKLATRLAERAQVPGAFELPLLIALGLVTTSATGLAIHYAVEAPLGRALNRTIGGKPRAARAAQPVNPASRLRTVGEE